MIVSIHYSVEINQCGKVAFNAFLITPITKKSESVAIAQLLKKSAWLLHLIGDKASLAARALSRRCYPHTGSGGHRWCLGSSLSLFVRLSISDEDMDVARSTPQGAHYHEDD